MIFCCKLYNINYSVWLLIVWNVFSLLQLTVRPHAKMEGCACGHHICVCTPGSKGKSCEQTTLPPSSHPTGPLNGHTNGGLPNGGHTNGYPNGHNVIPQRPIPQQIFPQGQGQVPLPLPGTNMRHLTLSMKPSPNGPIPYQPQWVWHLDSVIYSIIILRHGSDLSEFQS